ncbi:hypothetical protein ZWY2020_029894 [Hordeum vulgare]|nr:hypothetical protein ZWY2020_029894 [Hordeum vulgare]
MGRGSGAMGSKAVALALLLCLSSAAVGAWARPVANKGKHVADEVPVAEEALQEGTWSFADLHIEIRLDNKSLEEDEKKYAEVVKKYGEDAEHKYKERQGRVVSAELAVDTMKHDDGAAHRVPH